MKTVICKGFVMLAGVPVDKEIELEIPDDIQDIEDIKLYTIRDLVAERGLDFTCSLDTGWVRPKYPEQFPTYDPKGETGRDLGVVTEVTDCGDSFGVRIDSHTGFFLRKSYGVTPKVEDAVVLYSHWFARTRGLRLNGDLVYFLSLEDMEAEDKRRYDEMVKEKEEKFKRELPRMDIDFHQLPEIFKRRILRFRSEGPNFRKNYEAAELFVLKEAVYIQRTLRSPHSIRSVLKSNHAKRHAALPRLSKDHSGNTEYAAFHFALRLARYKQGPKDRVLPTTQIINAPGVMVQLVGSKAYTE